MEAVNYFKSLFCTTEDVINDAQEPVATSLNEEGRNALSKPITKEKVYQALMSMKSY